MGISIKGIVVGYLVTLLAGLVMGIGVGYTMAAIYGPEGARALLSPTAFPILIVAMIVSTLGGYVAARFAPEGEVLTGALCIMAGGTLSAVISGMDAERMAQNIIQIAVYPIFGALGGYIRLRQVQGS
jgi:hypothetical protein